MHSMSDLTRSDQEYSDFGPTDNSYDPSFTTLRMQSDRGSKRARRSDSGEMGAMFEFDRSLELEAELHENTFDRDIAAPPRSVELPTMQRQLSITDGPERQHSINFEDCFLERQPRVGNEERRNYMFMGLALVFGAVGTVSSMGGLDQVDTSVAGGSMECNSGMSLKGSDKMSMGDSMPLKHGDDNDGLVSPDPSSTS